MIVETPKERVAVAVAPEPPPPAMLTEGAVEYPLPTLVKVTTETLLRPFMLDQTSVSLKPAVRTAWSTALFCTGSISLNSSGTSALYGTAACVVLAGYAAPAVVPPFEGAVVTTSMPIKPMGT